MVVWTAGDRSACTDKITYLSTYVAGSLYDMVAALCNRCESLMLLLPATSVQMSSQEAKDATSLEVFLRSQLANLSACDAPSVKSPGEAPLSPKSPGGVPTSSKPELLSPSGGTRRSKVSKHVVG